MRMYTVHCMDHAALYDCTKKPWLFLDIGDVDRTA